MIPLLQTITANTANMGSLQVWPGPFPIFGRGLETKLGWKHSIPIKNMQLQSDLWPARNQALEGMIKRSSDQAHILFLLIKIFDSGLQTRDIRDYLEIDGLQCLALFPDYWTWEWG